MKLSVNPDSSFSHHIMAPERNYPNNLKLPVLFYKQVLHLGEKPEDDVKELLQSNGWTNSWTGGIDNYYHYHSTAHEALVVIKGDCMVQFGGDDGNIQKITAGDVVVIPAGVAHKNLAASPDLSVVGAYPDGQQYDMKKGEAEEMESAKENISKVPLPTNDPVFGDKGPVREIWKMEKNDPILQKERQF
jgi:uncharacterized protein YjlB